MVERDVLVDGVLAATDKLVKQAGQGDWTSVAKTVEQRRLLLDALAQSEPSKGEHDFLKALRAAAAESEAALAVMAPSNVSTSGSSLCTKA